MAECGQRKRAHDESIRTTGCLEPFVRPIPCPRRNVRCVWEGGLGARVALVPTKTLPQPRIFRNPTIVQTQKSTFLSRMWPSCLAGLDWPQAPVAQWIERRPPEPEVTGSNPVGRAYTRHMKPIRGGLLLAVAVAVLLVCPAASWGAYPGANGLIAYDEPRGDLPDCNYATMNNEEIFTISPAGGEPTQLTDNAAPDLYPSWSPDGRRSRLHPDVLSGIRKLIEPSDGARLHDGRERGTSAPGHPGSGRRGARLLLPGRASHRLGPQRPDRDRPHRRNRAPQVDQAPRPPSPPSPLQAHHPQVIADFEFAPRRKASTSELRHPPAGRRLTVGAALPRRGGCPKVRRDCYFLCLRVFLREGRGPRKRPEPRSSRRARQSRGRQETCDSSFGGIMFIIRHARAKPEPFGNLLGTT